MTRKKTESVTDPDPDPQPSEEAVGEAAVSGSAPRTSEPERASSADPPEGQEPEGEPEEEAPATGELDPKREYYAGRPVFGYLVALKKADKLSTRRRPAEGSRVRITIEGYVGKRVLFEPENNGWIRVIDVTHEKHMVEEIAAAPVEQSLFDLPAEAHIVDAEGILKEHVATCEHCYTGSSLNSTAGKCGDYMQLLADYRVEHPAEFGDEPAEGGEAPSETGVVDLTTEEEEPAHA